MISVGCSRRSGSRPGSRRGAAGSRSPRSTVPPRRVLTGEARRSTSSLRSCEEEGVRARAIRGAVRLPLGPRRGLREDAARGICADLAPQRRDPLLLHRHRELIDTASWTPSTGTATSASRCASSRLCASCSTRATGCSSRRAHTRSWLGRGRRRSTRRRGAGRRASRRHPAAREGGGGALCPLPAEAQLHGAELDWDAFFAGGGAASGRTSHLPLPAPAVLARRRRRRRRPAEAGLPRRITRCSGRRSRTPRREGSRSPVASRSIRTPGWPTTPPSTRCCCLARPSLSWRCRAGAEAGAGVLEELTLEAPLVVATDTACCGSRSPRPDQERPP